MKKIAFFCIPAHGHTNPMLPVASELVKRGNTVRFYSFDAFESKIRATGADFVSCEAFLGELTEKEEAGLKNVSTTEMTIQDIRITLSMDAFLDEEFKAFQPDVSRSLGRLRLRGNLRKDGGRHSFPRMLMAFFSTSRASCVSRSSRFRRAISFCSSDA